MRNADRSLRDSRVRLVNLLERESPVCLWLTLVGRDNRGAERHVDEYLNERSPAACHDGAPRENFSVLRRLCVIYTSIGSWPAADRGGMDPEKMVAKETIDTHGEEEEKEEGVIYTR